MTPSLLLATGFETLLNYYLRLDPEVPPKLKALSGKVIGLELIFSAPGGLPLEKMQFDLFLLPGAGGIQVVDSYPGIPDVTIRGTPLAMARLSRQGVRAISGSGVEIEGDTHVGGDFQTLLAAVDIDWEEQLSQLLGDAVAHQAGNILRGFQVWGRKTLDTLYRDASEYLQEEAGYLPPSGALIDFLNAVDTLRSDVDRLEARVRRLQRTYESSH